VPPTSPRRTLPALYAILDVDLCEARGVQPRRLVDEWLDAGVRLIQLRAKHLTLGPFLQLAESLAAACRRAGAIFIVNDRVDVARLSGADGVHLGQEDLPPGDARAAWPDARWIGWSTHSDAQLAGALASGATYIAIGPVFQTTTKAHPDPVVGLEGVRRAARLVGPADRPLVAIGGITIDRALDVLAAGATSVAVVSGLVPALDGDLGAREWVRRLG